MVCNRCIKVVSETFEDAGIHNATVEMGKVSIEEPLSDGMLTRLQKQLTNVGFEIIKDSKSRIIEEIKKLSIDFVYNDSGESTQNFSDYLSGHLNHDYNYLSSIFSSVEGKTIEKYLINLKIERVKELLVYYEKTLSEIAFEMGYSSVAHLSGQFKKVTGFTPSWFKKLGEQKRKSIDKV